MTDAIVTDQLPKLCKEYFRHTHIVRYSGYTKYLIELDINSVFAGINNDQRIAYLTELQFQNNNIHYMGKTAIFATYTTKNNSRLD